MSTISIMKEGGRITAGVTDQLALGNREELRQLVLDELERGERSFRIDFRQTDYIDSSGLGVLVSLSKRIRERGGELRLTNLNDELRSLFALAKLDTFFQIGDDDDRAGRAAPLGSHTRGPGVAADPWPDAAGPTA